MFYSESPDIACLTEKQINDIRHEVQISIKGDDVPRPMLEFSNCNLPEKRMFWLLKA
jgi:hypothetical protein